MQSQRLLPNNHNTESEIIHAAWSGKKAKLVFMLKTIMISEETLYLTIKQMINRKSKSQLDWEIIKIVIDDARFNPNYYNESLRSICLNDNNKNIFKYTENSHLIKIAIIDECYASVNLLLNHPKINLENLENGLFKIAIENSMSKTINWLLRNSRFFAFEKDWLTWAQEKCTNLNAEKYPNLKIVFALNFCWHNWIKFTPSWIAQGFHEDIINEVTKNLCHVSLFAKKHDTQTSSSNPSFNCGPALC